MKTEVGVLMRRWTGLVGGAWLLVAGAAQAQYPQKPGWGGQPSPGSCSQQEAMQIETAFREAAQMVRYAIRALDENPNLPEFRRWFGAGPVAPVRRNLVNIADYLARQRPQQIACNSPSMCPRGRYAYTMNASGAMGFCELFFRARSEGWDSRAGIVVHEVSHAAARTRDTAYSTRGAAVLAKDDPAAAANNADNYEYFVESLRR
jgi:hypothetical protein